MIKYLLLVLTIFSALQTIEAQHTRHIVKFKDKAGTPFAINNASPYLSPRSIERRTRYNISIDSTDLPVTPRYIDSIRNAGTVTILNVSKWLNQVSIQTSDAAALAKISTLPFVQSVAPIAARVNNTNDNDIKNKFKEDVSEFGQRSSIASTNRSFSIASDFYNYGLSYPQVRIHNGEFLHNIGLRGQNMIIGMLDAGYFNYTSLRAFDSVRIRGQILDTYDFVAREVSIVEDNAHGMYCFSIMAANIPGEFVGTAPGANYFLYRSEDAATEYPIEEHNWVCAAERVDSAGGDVINSSLGYATFDDPSFNYTYSQLNGNIAMSTIGADLAAKKGILVLNSVGNSGSSSWKFLGAPSDGDSVIAVGAVNSSGAVGSFSSYGHSSDGQIKPDVASVGVGTVIQLTNNTIGSGNGTSFASPNMAGLATCLWQGFREFNNMKIANALRQAGSIASAPNDRIGYGIPDMKKAVISLLKDYSTATATVSACRSTINWSSKDMSAMKYEIERRAPGQTSFTKISDRFGTGSIFSNQSYQYIDSLVNVQSGTVTYRIRQIIDTSAAGLMADYIDTVSVSLASSCITTGIDPITGNGAEVVLIPNPANDKVSLKITTTNSISNLHIRITDAAGRTVRMMKENKPSGTTIFPINISNLPRGKYFVVLYDNQRILETMELLKL